MIHHASDKDIVQMIQHLAEIIDPEDKEWSSKYGFYYQSPVFLCHPYCGCEEEDCPWCVSCTCPDSATHYYIDGDVVSSRQWADYFEREDAKIPDTIPFREKVVAWDKINSHRTRVRLPECEFCQTGSVARMYGGSPGNAAPNFYHIDSGLRVSWYKYLGRSMEIDNRPTVSELREIEARCEAYIQKTLESQ